MNFKTYQLALLEVLLTNTIRMAREIQVEYYELSLFFKEKETLKKRAEKSVWQQHKI